MSHLPEPETFSALSKLVEVAGIEPETAHSQGPNCKLVSITPDKGCTQIGTHFSEADIKTFGKIAEIWPKLPTSVKVSILMLVEAQGGLAAW